MAWTQVEGTVVGGHGAASGLKDDPRFPEGTLALQQSFFAARGLDLSPYHRGTINVSIAPYRPVVRQARHTFRNVRWTDQAPAEDFSFFDCRIHRPGEAPQAGLIYYPHPETKPEHHQALDVLEILTTYLDGLQYGDPVILELDPDQMAIQQAAP